MTEILILSIFTIVCLGVVLIFLLLWTSSQVKKANLLLLHAQRQWDVERRDLLNRIQSRDPLSYQAMTAVTPTIIQSNSDYIGNSDEDELSRSTGINDWSGLGDPFVDLSAEARELGLINGE